MISSQSRHSARMVRTKRSAWAFACGARIGVWMTLMPSLRKTSSKAAANLLSVVDQKPHPLKDASEAKVARLLGYPDTGRVGRSAGQVDAAAFELDEEEHVEAAQRERLDGEEIAGEHARRLLAEEVAPGWARASRRGPETVGKQDAPDRARRYAQAQFQQLAGDPWIAPIRILPCEPQHQWRMRSSTGERPRLRRGCVHLRRTSSRCQRRGVCGVTIKPSRRDCGKTRVSAARKARSAGCGEGRRCWRPSTTS
jgi:hypothetical protein